MEYEMIKNEPAGGPNTKQLPSTTHTIQKKKKPPKPDGEVFWECKTQQNEMSTRLPTTFNICGFDLVSDKRYLPDPNYLDLVQAYPPESWRLDSALMIEAAVDLQNPLSCENPFSEDKGRFHLLKLIQAGIGFNVYLFTNLVSRHLEVDVPVMVNENSYWRFTDSNCGRGYTCHLRNLTKCRVDDVPRDKVVALTHHGWPFPTLANVCGEHGTWIPAKGRCLCRKGYVPQESGQSDPACRKLKPNEQQPRISDMMDRFHKWGLTAPGEVDVGGSGCPYSFVNKRDERYKHGYFWWHAQYLNWLITEADNYKNTQGWAKEMGLDHLAGDTCIAVHVRHGDACMDPYSKHRTCHSWTEYLAAIEEMERIYGNQKSIFLATDNQTIVDDAVRMNHAGRRLVYQNISRAKYKPRNWGDTVDVRREFSKPEIVTEFMQDVVGLSMCGYFIGTFTSSVGWITTELQSARLGHYRPFIALDMPYGHKKNVGRFPTFEDKPKPQKKRLDT